MGLDLNSTRFVLYARRRGVSYHRTAMIGRQELHLSKAALRQTLRAFGFPISRGEVDRIVADAGGFAEPLLKYLGAEDIRSFDASGFEEATDIHDLNLPVPGAYHGAFSAVLDSGSLEHIFNFPRALENCLNMVAEGGHFVGIMPGNNLFGHGFYQFSPEICFRVFTHENGFRLRALMVFERPSGRNWFEVVDPAVTGERATLINSRATYVAVIAQKTRSVRPFANPPQQADYAARWSAYEGGANYVTGGASWKRYVPASLKRAYRRVRMAVLLTRYERKYFRPIRVSELTEAEP